MQLHKANRVTLHRIGIQIWNDVFSQPVVLVCLIMACAACLPKSLRERRFIAYPRHSHSASLALHSEAELSQQNTPHYSDNATPDMWRFEYASRKSRTRSSKKLQSATSQSSANPLLQALVTNDRKLQKQRKTTRSFIDEELDRDAAASQASTSKQAEAVPQEKQNVAQSTAGAKQFAANYISDNQSDQQMESEIAEASRPSASSLFGRSVCIAITGVDSRIGVAQRHADANHVLRIWLDKGEIEVLSVPRGTPVNAGFSSPGLNYLANYRSNKGREAYHKKLAELTGVGKIDYWVEMGFSQAIGLIELLGFKDNAKTTLHVLRTRKAFGIGDYQRCYNQGQFIRQMLLNNFNKSTGFLGSIALRGALGLVETNMKHDVAKSIIEQLEQHKFPQNPKTVSVRLRPPFKARLQEFDLSSQTAITDASKKLDSRLKSGGHMSTSSPAFNPTKYEKNLAGRVARAEKLLSSKPKAAAATLQLVYTQRSWIQIPDRTRRDDYMKRICTTLAAAYEAQGMIIEADNVRYFYELQHKGGEMVSGVGG